MAFCPSCGAQVEGRFCAKCGATVQSGPSAPPQPPPSPGYGAPPPQGAAYGSTPPGQGYGAPQQGYGQQGYGAPQPPAQGGGLEPNIASALCYLLGLLTGILFLALAPYNKNRAIRFHAFQSIFLNVAWIGFWIVLTIVQIVFNMVHLGIVNMLLGLLSLLLSLGFMVLWVMLMVKAYQGSRLFLPVIGPLAEKQA